jgi:dihydroorotate dehydrogenase subfamily 2
MLIATGKIIVKLPLVKTLLRVVFRYEDTRLTQTVCGIRFDNPIGLSAGFDKNFELIELLPQIGFGFVEGGSLTAKPSDGNPRPHYHRLKQSKSILVNAGLNNHGVDAIIKRIKRYKTISYPLNVSVAKTNALSAASEQEGIDDYVVSLKKLKQANIGNVITINISCPNAFGGEPYTTPERLEKLLSAVDAVKLTVPVFIKMPVDKPWSEFKLLLDVILRHTMSGVTIGNLAKNRDNPHIKDELTPSLKGNMSGRPTWDLSNNLISKTYAYCGDKLIIIGVGGVFSAADAYEKITRGATLVELITGMIFEGPSLIGQINDGLVSLLDDDGYTTISDAIGAQHRR